MKKTLAIVLALLMMLSVLTACASEPAAPVDTPTTNTPATETPADTPEEPAEEPAETPAEEPAEEPADVPAEEPAADPEVGTATAADTVDLPIADELTSFGIWAGADIGAVGMDDLNESPTWQEVERLTNVHLDWELVSTNAKTEQFNLMLVSENYPEVISNGVWSSDLGYYIEEEVLINLRPLIEEFAPNYQAIRTRDEQTMRDTLLDDNSIGAFYRIKAPNPVVWVGQVIRDDLLEELGLEVPVTVDDYTNVLTAFKDAGVEIPLGTWADGFDPVFLATYGLAGGAVQGKWHHEGDQVVYSPASPTFKDYLTQMNAWYEARLLDQEFYVSGGSALGRFDEIADGTIACFNTQTVMIAMPMNMSSIEGFSLLPIENPLLEEGGTTKIANCVSVLNCVEGASRICISTTCHDPELFVKYMDFFYTKQGSDFITWGLEDVTYTVDENGNKAMTDLINNNPDGFSQQQAKMKYGIHKDALTYDYDWSNEREDVAQYEKVVKIYDENVWNNNWVDERTMPQLSLTVEENEAAGVLGDINTYVSEMVVKFIIGEESLDNFDAYVEKLYEMGLQDAIDANQTAYERYLTRG